MNNFLTTASVILTLVGVLVLPAEHPALAQVEPQPKTAPLAALQTDINRFERELRSVVANAEIPKREAFEKRIKEETGELEIITDGYGGVVDFNAAKGTVQYVANEMSKGMPIEWEFELGKASFHSDKMIVLEKKFAGNADGQDGKKERPIFGAIEIKKSNAGRFKAGDRVKLKATIDDFGRFRKDFSAAAGLVAIHYLEDVPVAFLLKLEEAEITLLDPLER